MTLFRQFRERISNGVRILVLVAGLISCAPARALPAQEPGGEALRVAGRLLAQTSALRGLEPKTAIARSVKSKEEISSYLDARVRREFDGERLEMEGVLLKKLGLIPPALDYRGFVLSLLTEQVGGMYDPESRTFFIADWLTPEEQKPVMVHEFVHALQDQHFDLNRLFVRTRDEGNSDRAMALQALAEGDATGVMLDYLLAPLGRNFLELPDLALVMRAQASAVEAQYGVLRQAPDYLKEVLLFPYGYGTGFVQRLRAGGKPWTEADKAYLDPPSSTEQIMHPEKYLAGREDPVKVDPPDPATRLGDGWSERYRNVLGEFTLYLMLRMHVSEGRAKTAAAGWGGDQAILAAKTGQDLTAAVVSLAWDSGEDAAEFFEMFSLWLNNRYPKARRLASSAGDFSISVDGEVHSIRIEGSQTEVILGLPAEPGRAR